MTIFKAEFKKAYHVELSIMISICAEVCDNDEELWASAYVEAQTELANTVKDPKNYRMICLQVWSD